MGYSLLLLSSPSLLPGVWGHRPQSTGVRGYNPWNIFEIVNVISCILVHPVDTFVSSHLTKLLALPHSAVANKSN
jgi:hypothetical protein